VLAIIATANAWSEAAWTSPLFSTLTGAMPEYVAAAMPTALAVGGISGGGRDGNVAAVRHTDWAATNGEPTVGSTHRRGARNIPAVLDADGC
jgi:hypothetical protein